MASIEKDSDRKLSIVIPAFNEQNTIQVLVHKVIAAELDVQKEIIVVDDGSNDGTTVIIRQLELQGLIIAYFHEDNKGKGACLRTGFKHAQGDLVLIQDADLEYDPKDIPRLIQPIIDGRADVVYGTRFHARKQRVHLFWHRLANTILTLLSNIHNNLSLSDMETGYKAFRREVLHSFSIKENRFGVEPEITAKIARRNFRILEVPISYTSRNYQNGKKIGLKDAFRAFWCIIRYRLAD